MAALRDLPRAGRQLLGAAAAKSPHWNPCTTSLRRCASSQAAAAAAPPQPPIPDIETDSGLAVPIVTRDDVRLVDPRKRASRRNHELPHER